MTKEGNLIRRLEQGLSTFTDTIELVNYLLTQKQSSQEIILLTCARLDSLANLAFKNIKGQEQAFRKFILDYSGNKRFFNRISVGDLYSYLTYYGILSQGGLIEKPGRIRKFGSESVNFIEFIKKSGIPIIDKDVSRLAFRIARILSKYFRVKPNQSLKKSYMASRTKILDTISKEFIVPNFKVIKEALKVLLDDFKASSLLYKNYRCDVIHGLKVEVLEDAFFEKTKPFHGEYGTGYGTTFRLVFPGPFLRDLLEKCLNQYLHHLKKRRKIPLELLFKMYPSEEFINSNVFDYIDDESYDDFEEVNWKL
ncbi:hypothetical protein KAX02_12325 [candidate division WOR-3 bacterium]|nr:hypothetical protein [candidate division WOR-3 bacterium]